MGTTRKRLENGYALNNIRTAEILQRLEIEKNAKNIAYMFIISHGLLEAFITWNKERSKEDTPQTGLECFFLGMVEDSK